MLDRRSLARAAGGFPTAATTAPRWSRAAAEDVVRWLVVVLGLSIPVSVVADNVLLSIIGGAWIFGGGYREKLDAIRANPVALAAIALFALYLAGTLYSVGSDSDVLMTVSKGARLLLIPALIPLMRDVRWRRRGLAAFQASMIVTLVISYLIWSGVMPPTVLLKGTPDDPVAFKAHITHNVFMAFTAFLFALAAVDARTRRARIVLGLLCTAAVVNVLVMVPGRTGHIVFAVLFAYFLYRQFGAKGFALAIGALAALAVVVFLSPDTMLHKRITLADDELQQWRSGAPPDLRNSVGLRLEMLRNTIEVIRDNPILGVGTGGFGKAYAELANRTGDTLTKNPHNEFLMIVAQFGLAGFVVLVCVFGTQWWAAARLPERSDQTAARALVITMVVASVLSSTLIDHAEGVFFVYMSALLFAGYEGLPARRRQ
ncbi:MAG TPA: O-antigen ligase family protein [Casimicrobiaceae bacterium]|nr:O-antigen ligase family protein [Casimicrobiaceae bacterium]